MHDKMLDLLNQKPENFCIDLVTSVDTIDDFPDIDYRDYKLSNKSFKDLKKLKDRVKLLRKKSHDKVKIK